MQIKHIVIHKVSKYRLISSLFLICSSLTWGANFYVSSATDISIALNSTSPGDTLTMTNGLWVDQHIVFDGVGTESLPIILRAASPGNVILTGSSTLRISGEYLIVDGLYFRNGYSNSGGVVEFRSSSSELATHCRLTNTAIVDYNPQSINNNYKWVSIYGSYNRVDNCYFRGKNHDGATLVVWFRSVADPPAHYHLIDHNYFAHRPELGFNGGETIRVGTSSYSMSDSYTTVEWNYFEHCDGEIEIISNKSCENIYRYNTFFESEGTLTLRHGNRCTVSGNFFFGNGQSRTGGVRIIGEDHKVFNNYFYNLSGSGYRSAITFMNGVPNSPLNRYFQVKRAEVSYNTIVDCYQPFMIGAGANSELTLPPLDCTIANNAVAASSAYQIFTIEDDPIHMDYVTNIVWGATLGLPDTTSGIQVTDPLLELAADSLWRPQTGSPLIGSATDQYTYVTTDMDGQTRSGSLDIGADQVTTDSVQIYPITAADVGPSWYGAANSPVFIIADVNGSGTITLIPDTNIFMPGDTVIISATPDSAWSFLEWRGDLNGTTNPQTVIVNDDMYITAVFSPPVQYQIYQWIIGTGEIVYNPPGPYYNPGTTVEINAIPGDGWLFTDWGGDINSSQNPDTVVLNDNMAITATFELITGVKHQTGLPTTLELFPNYPNPFNNTTRISYQVPLAGFTTIRIFVTNGCEVFERKSYQIPGYYYIDWNANGLPTGVYILQFSSDRTMLTQKLLLIK